MTSRVVAVVGVVAAVGAVVAAGMEFRRLMLDGYDEAARTLDLDRESLSEMQQGRALGEVLAEGGVDPAEVVARTLQRSKLTYVRALAPPAAAIATPRSDSSDRRRSGMLWRCSGTRGRKSRSSAELSRSAYAKLISARFRDE